MPKVGRGKGKEKQCQHCKEKKPKEFFSNRSWDDSDHAKPTARYCKVCRLNGAHNRGPKKIYHFSIPKCIKAAYVKCKGNKMKQADWTKLVNNVYKLIKKHHPTWKLGKLKKNNYKALRTSISNYKYQNGLSWGLKKKTRKKNHTVTRLSGSTKEEGTNAWIKQKFDGEVAKIIPSAGNNLPTTYEFMNSMVSKIRVFIHCFIFICLFSLFFYSNHSHLCFFFSTFYYSFIL